MVQNPDPSEPQEKGSGPRRTSRFAISIDELQTSAHVSLDSQVVEVPTSVLGRAPGDDDFTRNQRGVINPGV
jgi:hypothetical protein